MIARHLLAACLLIPLIPPAAALAAPCECDCNGDGTVNISELITALTAAIGESTPGCENAPQCPPGEACLIIAALVQCVGNALNGCPPEPTPTLVPGGATLPALLDAVAPQICADVVSSTPGGRFDISAQSDTGEVQCGSFTGHTGWVRLTRYASVQAATTAFGDADVDEDVDDVVGGPLRILVSRDSSSGGTFQDWRWLRGCWITTGHAFDDTEFRIAPQPHTSVALIAASPLFADLLAGCEGLSQS